MTLFSGFDQAVVVDVETTGLDPKRDRIVSIALIRSNFGNLRKNPDLSGKTMEIMINPQRNIPKRASRIHGITNKDVADKAPFSDVAKELREFIGDSPIIAHNASFDKRFLNAEFKRSGVKTLARNRSYCTMLRFQDLIGHRYGSKLDDVAEVMGIEGRTGKIHNALEDAGLAWYIAGFFYVRDNGIEIPHGKPLPLVWSDKPIEENGRENSNECSDLSKVYDSDKPNEDDGRDRQHRKPQSKTRTRVIAFAIVVAILIWWFY